MKKHFKLLSLLLSFVVVLSVGSVKAEPKIFTVELTIDNPVPIVNGEERVPLDLPVRIYNSRVMVPIRFFCEELSINCEVEWKEKKIKFTTETTQIELQINNPIVKINGIEKLIDSPAIILSGRTIVPVRFIMETFGATVTWDPDLHKATIVYEIPEE